MALKPPSSPTQKRREAEAWARVALGMPAAEFRRLLPREWAAIVKEYRKELERQDTIHAHQLLIIAQAGGMKRKSGADLKLDDFRLLGGEKKAKKRRRQSGADMLAVFMAITNRQNKNG